MKRQILTFSISAIIIIMWLGTGACGTQKTKAQSDGLMQYTGSFESVQGVKNPLSCFCYKGAYLSLESGERIALCFNENAQIGNCKKMTVWGNFETKIIKLSPENPCSEERKKIFSVKKFECQ